MADCGPIIGLKLDQVSQKAIQQINDNGKVGKLIATVATLGVFNSIFTKNKAPVAGYNIMQTDWELYAKAMSSLPDATKVLVQKEIDAMILHYYIPSNHDNRHLKFWRAMKNGCR